MFGDAGDFMGVKAQVQRVQDATGTGNSEECLQMARMIPHHGSNAVARLQAEFCESGRETARPAVEFSVTAANNGLVRLSRNNFDPGENLPRTLQNGRERQRKIHHRTAHGPSRTGTNGPHANTNSWPAGGYGRAHEQGTIRAFYLVANEGKFRDHAADR